MLNYLYALLESEASLALAALGLDPGIGVLHADTPARDSLACDLMEPVRPKVGENLRWETVRVLFYRQQKPDGQVIEAFWLTDSPIAEVSSRVLFHRAKSRWEIENQGFHDAKNRHDLEHICHHHPNSLLITWLLTCLALTIERLYRLRYLRRGTHPPRSAADFVHVLWLSLSRPAPADSS